MVTPSGVFKYMHRILIYNTVSIWLLAIHSWQLKNIKTWPWTLGSVSRKSKGQEVGGSGGGGGYDYRHLTNTFDIDIHTISNNELLHYLDSNVRNTRPPTFHLKHDTNMPTTQVVNHINSITIYRNTFFLTYNLYLQIYFK